MPAVVNVKQRVPQLKQLSEGCVVERVPSIACWPAGCRIIWSCGGVYERLQQDGDLFLRRVSGRLLIIHILGRGRVGGDGKKLSH